MNCLMQIGLAEDAKFTSNRGYPKPSRTRLVKPIDALYGGALQFDVKSMAAELSVKRPKLRR